MPTLNNPDSRSAERLIELPYRRPARRAYFVTYYALALPAVMRPHRLNLPSCTSVYRVEFRLTEAEQQAWRDLFGLEGNRGRQVPLTYASSAATPAFMHLLSRLGINFKYLRHVASEIDFIAAEPALKPEVCYTYTASLKNIFAVGQGRVVLELGSSVFDAAARLCSVHTDYFIVSGFKREQLLGLEASPCSADRFDRVSAYTRELTGTARDLSIPPMMGVRYGQLSGDMNIVHTTGFAARLMGFPKPFIQGFCTVNLLLSYLLPQPGFVMKRFSCTFVRPIFVGEKLALFSEGERFELCNEAGKVVVYGEGYQAPWGLPPKLRTPEYE